MSIHSCDFSLLLLLFFNIPTFFLIFPFDQTAWCIHIAPKRKKKNVFFVNQVFFFFTFCLFVFQRCIHVFPHFSVRKKKKQYGNLQRSKKRGFICSTFEFFFKYFKGRERGGGDEKGKDI